MGESTGTVTLPTAAPEAGDRKVLLYRKFKTCVQSRRNADLQGGILWLMLPHVSSIIHFPRLSYMISRWKAAEHEA